MDQNWAIRIFGISSSKQRIDVFKSGPKIPKSIFKDVTCCKNSNGWSMSKPPSKIS